MKKKKQLKKPKPLAQVAVAVVIVLLGITAIVRTHAAKFAAASETESGTLASNATDVSNVSASGAHAVQFGSSSSGITFNHCASPTYTLPTNPSNPQDGVTLSGYHMDTDTWNFSKYPSSQQTIYACN